MLWHTELLIHAILITYLWRRPDGRPKFAAWLACRFIFDLGQLAAERGGLNSVATSYWYLGIVLGCVLLFFAAEEAATYRPTNHRRILYAWMALNAACAWIRFFPYTGRAVLIVDGIAFTAWLAEKALWRMRR